VVDRIEALAAENPLPLFRAAKARLLYDVGRRDEAVELLTAEAELGSRTCATCRGWLCSAIGPRWPPERTSGPRSTSPPEQLLPWAAQVICTRTHVAGAVAHYLGLLDAARGDEEAAMLEFHGALDTHARLAAPFHLARTHLALGRLLLTRPGAGPAEAHPHLEAARELAVGAGCAFVASAAEDLARRN
jgi:hypothetical protein